MSPSSQDPPNFKYPIAERIHSICPVLKDQTAEVIWKAGQFCFGVSVQSWLETRQKAQHLPPFCVPLKTLSRIMSRKQGELEKMEGRRLHANRVELLESHGLAFYWKQSERAGSSCWGSSWQKHEWSPAGRGHDSREPLPECICCFGATRPGDRRCSVWWVVAVILSLILESRH